MTLCPCASCALASSSGLGLVDSPADTFFHRWPPAAKRHSAIYEGAADGFKRRATALADPLQSSRFVSRQLGVQALFV